MRRWRRWPVAVLLALVMVGAVVVPLVVSDSDGASGGNVGYPASPTAEKERR